jgi:hypothetical protein
VGYFGINTCCILHHFLKPMHGTQSEGIIESMFCPFGVQAMLSEALVRCNLHRRCGVHHVFAWHMCAQRRPICYIVFGFERDRIGMSGHMREDEHRKHRALELHIPVSCSHHALRGYN